MPAQWRPSLRGFRDTRHVTHGARRPLTLSMAVGVTPIRVARPLIGDIPIVATRLYPHLGGLAESPRSERAQRRLGATAYCPRAAWARVIAVATLRSPEASFGRGRRALTPPAAEPRPHRQPGVRARFRVSPASGEKRVARVDLARLLSSSRRRPAVLSDWRQSTAPPAPAPAIPLPRMQSPAPAQPRRVQRRPSAISRRAGASRKFLVLRR